MSATPLHEWSRGQTDPDRMTDAILARRLNQTIAWTNHLLTLGNTGPDLRTRETCPQILHEGYDDVICDLGTTRRFRLQELEIECNDETPSLHNGRLLCFFPDANLTDGAAEPETDGFFDIYNNPPWDTWVGYFIDNDDRQTYDRCYVLCYVPSQLISIVERGIIVNPEECIRWLGDTNVTMKQRLLGHQPEIAG